MNATRTVALALFVLIAAALGVLFWLLVVYPANPVSDGDEVVQIELPQDGDVTTVAKQLADADLIAHPRLWEAYMRLTGAAKRLRSGPIQFRTGMTPEEVARYAAYGLGAIDIWVTIPEGFTRFEIAARLEQQGVTGAREFISATQSRSVLSELGIEATTAEGFLFPDTYQFIDAMKAERVVQKMASNFRRRWDGLSGADALQKEFGWSVADIVTLASIVEKEAAVASERAMIAGVFLNRLRSKTFLPRHRLQADPTVSYGCIVEPRAAKSCKGFSGAISRAMLEDVDNRYNTYRHPGLPPGPIANPGLAALNAVLHPKRHRFLYFVARGGGRHAFSQTLRQHNINVRRYLRGTP